MGQQSFYIFQYDNIVAIHIEKTYRSFYNFTNFIDVHFFIAILNEIS